jgi:hypothetical protein
MPNYFYGTQVIHDSYNYFLTRKQNALPAYQQSLAPYGRFSGVYKTGERQSSIQIPVEIQVISQVGLRNDLENLVDTLLSGLALRQQQLMLHASDSRYWVADAVIGQVVYAAGRIQTATVMVAFLAEQPYLYGPYAAVYGTGVPFQFSLSGNTWYSPLITFYGGGNANVYPHISLENTSPLGITTLTSALSSGGLGHASITVAAIPLNWPTGLVQLVSGGNTQNVVVSVAASSGATSLTTTSFVANANYPIGTLVIPYGGASLTSALVNGNAYTSLACGAMPFRAGNGTTIMLNDTVGHTQTVTAPNGWAAGATSITVTSFNANFSYPINTTWLLPNTTITNVTVAQTIDGAEINIPTLGTAFGVSNTLDIYCDQSAVVEGGEVIANGSTTELFNGTLPWLRPGITQLQVIVNTTGVVQPCMSITTSWLPRWLS